MRMRPLGLENSAEAAGHCCEAEEACLYPLHRWLLSGHRGSRDGQSACQRAAAQTETRPSSRDGHTHLTIIAAERVA
jgi:hypothetical protein